MEKKYYIKTYGCQMNDLDGRQMGRLLKSKGYQPALEPEEADVILINTCSVREKASQKVYSEVGRFRSLKLRRPEVVLGITGCQAQAEGAHLQKRFPYLDLVIGPDHFKKIAELVEQVKQAPEQQIAQVGFLRREEYQFVDLLPEEEENQCKAFVNIMKGCDNFCSFCIVPAVRGREVCRNPEDILHEIHHLVSLGVKEVTLLGQNVNSYGVGRHAKESGMVSFSQLLQRISAETEIDRIRFTTSHPKDLSPELIEQFAKNPKLAKHFHLPVQSGSNAVLEKMYRGYTCEEYLEKLRKLRDVCPDLSISTDIIVGFCGETDADFASTLELLREARYDSIFSFVYSPRPKTTAGLYFADEIPDAVKRERLAILQEVQEEITLEKNKTWEGKVLEVLVEGPSRQGATLMGRSSQNHVVHFADGENQIGKIVPVLIRHAGPNSLVGDLLPQFLGKTEMNFSKFQVHGIEQGDA